MAPGALRRGTPVREALDSALVALEGAGVDTPRLDAEVLLAHALGVDRTALVLDPGREVAGEAARTFRDLITRRAVRREPVAYLVGTKGFRSFDLAVDPRVLIPRPETEHLVEVALAAVPQGAHVHDVGTGSGAVALALAHERPDLRVTASDISEDALAVARANAQRLRLDVAFHRGDLLEGVTAPYVVANLPYVETGARLAPELAHEPQGALHAGADGLDLLRRFAAEASGATWVGLEVGEGQAPAVQGLLRDGGFAGTAVERDLAGIERVVSAWR